MINPLINKSTDWLTDWQALITCHLLLYTHTQLNVPWWSQFCQCLRGQQGPLQTSGGGPPSGWGSSGQWGGWSPDVPCSQGIIHSHRQTQHLILPVVHVAGMCVICVYACVCVCVCVCVCCVCVVCMQLYSTLSSKHSCDLYNSTPPPPYHIHVISYFILCYFWLSQGDPQYSCTVEWSLSIDGSGMNI